MPATLPPTFDHYATHVIQQLVSRSAFVFLPSTSLDAHAPAILPDSTVSIVPEPGSTVTGAAGGKAKIKTGRPSALDLQRRAIRAMTALDAWATNAASLDGDSSAPSSSASPYATASITSDNYTQAKKILASTIHPSHISSAEQATLSKMKQLEEIWTRQGWDRDTTATGDAAEGGSSSNDNGREGIRQIEKAMGMPDGLLGLSRAVNADPDVGIDVEKDIE